CTPRAPARPGRSATARFSSCRWRIASASAPANRAARPSAPEGVGRVGNLPGENGRVATCPPPRNPFVSPIKVSALFRPTPCRGKQGRKVEVCCDTQRSFGSDPREGSASRRSPFHGLPRPVAALHHPRRRPRRRRLRGGPRLRRLLDPRLAG